MDAKLVELRKNKALSWATIASCLGVRASTAQRRWCTIETRLPASSASQVRTTTQESRLTYGFKPWTREDNAKLWELIHGRRLTHAQTAEVLSRSTAGTGAQWFRIKNQPRVWRDSTSGAALEPSQNAPAGNDDDYSDMDIDTVDPAGNSDIEDEVQQWDKDIDIVDPTGDPELEDDDQQQDMDIDTLDLTGDSDIEDEGEQRDTEIDSLDLTGDLSQDAPVSNGDRSRDMNFDTIDPTGDIRHKHLQQNENKCGYKPRTSGLRWPLGDSSKLLDGRIDKMSFYEISARFFPSLRSSQSCFL